MDEKKTIAPDKPADEKKPTAPAQPANEIKFRIEELRSHCVALFGVTISTFDGATSGLTGLYTKAAMKAHIDKWRKKEAKV